jgi:hypothetical protein
MPLHSLPTRHFFCNATNIVANSIFRDNLLIVAMARPNHRGASDRLVNKSKRLATSPYMRGAAIRALQRA